MHYAIFLVAVAALGVFWLQHSYNFWNIGSVATQFALNFSFTLPEHVSLLISISHYLQYCFRYPVFHSRKSKMAGP